MIAEAAGLLAQQTVAASASVLALPGVTSRRYANALFKPSLPPISPGSARRWDVTGTPSTLYQKGFTC
jgi:hypothetical protein